MPTRLTGKALSAACGKSPAASTLTIPTCPGGGAGGAGRWCRAVVPGGAGRWSGGEGGGGGWCWCREVVLDDATLSTH